ncbi:UPF0149 family protein [Legionella spiritensis]|uniref:UPF0149 family protein n=1 Tax=Legionella spiritensis TaxID=452 RepID=UPI000F71017A|nr:UPF0149 family protein [Legionella spiritensis]VEG91660.1 Putative conserved exported protein precursor [Legionella spiritensis]
MSVETNLNHMPAYQDFSARIAVLNLPVSSSELHGVMCGYLCAGASREGEEYLRALVMHHKDDATRAAALALFNVYALSQQQIDALDFEFQLLLPDEHEPLVSRAQAFSEWCEGFTQGITMAGVSYDQFDDDEAQEVLQHILEFAQLDYESLQVDEEDEKALMEVSEYARMAVLRLHGDLLHNEGGRESGHSDITH